MSIKKTIAVVAIFVSCFSYGQEITNTKFGKGILNLVAKDSSWSLKFAARAQVLSTTEWDINDGDFGSAENNFSIRRARLKFGGFAFSPKLTYKIELGLSNRDVSGASEFNRNTPRIILDAVVKWNFYENFTLWAGQTKLPGNRERVISSGNLQFVDRSLLNSRFNIDRDLGIQLRHHFNITDNIIVREAIAISQGEGRNVTEGNLGGHQYTARVELLPFGEFTKGGDYSSSSDLDREPKPKLALGAVYDFNDNAVRSRSNLGGILLDFGNGEFFETDIKTFFLDAIFKYRGFSFSGEYAHRDASEPIVVDLNGDPTGDFVEVGDALSLQSGYLFKNNWEIAGRYTFIDYDQDITGRELQEQYTLGVSKYIVGHKLKVQSDISYTTVAGDGSGLMYRLQFDIHF
ncbi:porin [Leptobacterium flavescens]|uniref:Porin n=1 Tax=Leptobacterium flavescens TaxID=472055 RepID=A0A6P0UHR5_9FLAO|nr:porin [Leptobacterium flavescens]NER12547.1 porin [Leptobacterium flavescens]